MSTVLGTVILVQPLKKPDPDLGPAFYHVLQDNPPTMLVLAIVGAASTSPARGFILENEGG